MLRTLSVLMTLGLAAPALADDHASMGDPVAGEAVYDRCKTCHMIQNLETEQMIVRGARTGPNLWGVIGRQAGSVEDFRYGKDLVAAGEEGLVWTEENLAVYVQDPAAFLKEVLDNNRARSRMTFKLREGGEDVAAYLATFSDLEEMEKPADSAPASE